MREGTCDPASQPWCRPGVWSYRRGDGPVILSYMPGSVQNPWAHIYYAMSEDVRCVALHWRSGWMRRLRACNWAVGDEVLCCVVLGHAVQQVHA